jgi:hypothetical protein
MKHWNFGQSRHSSLSLDDFLDEKDAAGFEFFAGKEPWLVGIQKITWQTFFKVCTEEMDDLSLKATRLVIEYCLEILDEVEGTISGKAEDFRALTPLYTFRALTQKHRVSRLLSLNFS